VFKTGMLGIMSTGELDKFEIGNTKVFAGEILAEAKLCIYVTILISKDGN
jgi:hypothetical protein